MTKPLTIEGIEKEFDERFPRPRRGDILTSGEWREIKSFYRSKISEMLEEMEAEVRENERDKLLILMDECEKEGLTLHRFIVAFIKLRSLKNQTKDTLKGKV